MFNIQPQELIVILVIALLVVGPRRLPELGRSIGRGLREIRKAQEDVRKTIQVNLDDDGRPRYGDARDGPKRAANGGTAAAAGAAGAAAGDDAHEISRTLGRGLAEIRRARTEIERSFRIDVGAPARPRSTTGAKPARRRDGTSLPEDAATTDDGAAVADDGGSSGEPVQPE